MLLQLLENRIAVFSAHTNLDFTEGGVSFALAERLGLQNIRFLSPLKDMMVKLAVFVPPIHVEKVSEAMARAGAGIIGQYSHCSFRLRGTGAFRGSTSTNPFIGRAGQLETVEEVRLEMISPRGRLSEIIEAMKQAHPYEEVAYDVYPLINESPNYGMGAVGELKSTTTLRQFLAMAKKRLRAQFVRYCGSLGKRIHRVAVCGGSGSDMLGDALHAKADAFVTADVRYHTFHDAHEDIALIDAGHWETEHVILKPLAEQLRTVIRQKKAKVEIQIKYSTNPIHSF
jgi:dinuclear metal center YbgI/SA1388 family protein